MDRNTVDWKGHWVALVAPFAKDGSLDEAAYRKNVALCLRNGVHGLVPAGCTGEFWALTKDERKRVMEICVDAARGRVPVVAGTGAVRTEDAIELTEHAKRVGCAGAMVITPYFVKPSPSDIVAHYEAISDAVALPLLVYNIPSATVNPVGPELADRLADVKNVVGIKESSFDFNNFNRIRQKTGDRLRLFGFELEGLLMGAVGSIHVHANYWDERATELYTAFWAGDIAHARDIERQTLAIEDEFNKPGRNYYVSVKTAMNAFGRPGGWPRKPLRPFPPEEERAFVAALKKLGLAPPKPLEAAAE